MPEVTVLAPDTSKIVPSTPTVFTHINEIPDNMSDSPVPDISMPSLNLHPRPWITPINSVNEGSSRDIAEKDSMTTSSNSPEPTGPTKRKSKGRVPYK